MDYSFLVKSEKTTNKFEEISRHKMISIDNKEIYHFGLIDYLQTWNFNKKKE